MCNRELQGTDSASRSNEHNELTCFSYAMGSFGVPLSWVIWHPFPASSVATTNMDTLQCQMLNGSCRSFLAIPLTYQSADPARQYYPAPTSGIYGSKCLLSGRLHV